MGNANKLLENCGYMLLTETSTEEFFVKPSNRRTTWIEFNKTKRHVNLGDNKCFTTRTILAIHDKCKELGWFNDGN